jgi:outer membrane protein
MRKKRVLIIILLVGAGMISGTAQKRLTPEEAVATALQNNYDIQLAKGDSLVAALDYSYRNAAFYPRVNANTGLTFNNNDQRQSFSDGTIRERKGIRSGVLTGSVALNWTLFDGFRMYAARDRLEMMVKSGGLSIRNQVVNTIAEIIAGYYNIVRQKQQLKALLEQMRLTEDRLKTARYKLEAGAGTKPEVLQTQIDLNAQKSAREQQLILIEQLKEILNQRMNVAPETRYDVSDTILINKNLVWTEIETAALQKNPLIRISKQNIDLAHIGLRERKAERWPVLSFNSAYNYNRTDNKAVVNPFQPLFSRNSGFNYGFTAAIPLFNNYTVKRQIAQAQLTIRLSELELKNQESQVKLQVLNAFKTYELQKKLLAIEEENILLVKENIQIVLEAYKQGGATFLQLREAQKSLEDAYNRLIAIRYAAKLAETELLRLQGEGL